MLSKNIDNKKCAPKLVFFNEKKIEKDSDDCQQCWRRKLTLNPILKIQQFPLGMYGDS